MLGIGSDKTAWTWLHKLRRVRVMVRPGRELLTGEVEVDPTFVGRIEKGGGDGILEARRLVVTAAEIRGSGIGRVRMKRIADGSSNNLTTFVREAAEIGRQAASAIRRLAQGAQRAQ